MHVNDALVAELDAFFASPPQNVDAVVLAGSGDHFCSGLDLAEHEQRESVENVYHSRNWHRVMDQIEFGGLPVVSALKGAVIGGGLEIAASTHVRVAEPSVRFQLPEGDARNICRRRCNSTRGPHSGSRSDCAK
jgi:enoyl-CoA hydratase/carnithine racemase